MAAAVCVPCWRPEVAAARVISTTFTWAKRLLPSLPVPGATLAVIHGLYCLVVQGHGLLGFQVADRLRSVPLSFLNSPLSPALSQGRIPPSP